MAIIIQCPSCNRNLKVPEHLDGKLVKCPSCQEQFTARVSAGADQQEPPKEPQPRQEYEEPADAPPPRPVQRRRSRAPFDDDYEDDEDGDYDDRPRTRRGRKEDTRKAVVLPAIFLMVGAGLSMVPSIFLAIGGFIILISEKRPDDRTAGLFLAPLGVLAVFWYAFIIFCGVQMFKIEELWTGNGRLDHVDAPLQLLLAPGSGNWHLVSGHTPQRRVRVTSGNSAASSAGRAPRRCLPTLCLSLPSPSSPSPADQVSSDSGTAASGRTHCWAAA